MPVDPLTTQEGGKAKVLLKDSELFRPDLVELYVNDLYTSPVFPARKLDALLDSSACSPSGSETAVGAMDVQLTSEEKEHVVTTIAALSALVSSYQQQQQQQKEEQRSNNDGTSSTSNDAHDKVLRARLKLGLCRVLLCGQEREAMVDLDMVRDRLYRRQTARERQRKKAAQVASGKNEVRLSSESVEQEREETEEGRMTIKALRGLEIVCIRMGKEQEARRFRQWRDKVAAMST